MMKKFLLILTLSLGSLWAASLDDLVGTYDFWGDVSSPLPHTSGTMVIAKDGKASLNYSLGGIEGECYENVIATLSDQDTLQLTIHCLSLLQGFLIDLVGVTDFEQFTAPMNLLYADTPGPQWFDVTFSRQWPPFICPMGAPVALQ